jgi:hypothetical protein
VRDWGEFCDGNRERDQVMGTMALEGPTGFFIFEFYYTVVSRYYASQCEFVSILRPTVVYG